MMEKSQSNSYRKGEFIMFLDAGSLNVLDKRVNLY